MNSHALTSLEDWLDFISHTHIKTIDMSLERVRVVFERLHLSPDCPTVLVGGTNGKGSTCAMLSSILKAGGYAVGTYTSPHLWSFNERIAINGEAVTNHQIITAFQAIEAVRQETPLTYFEWATLAAFWIFKQHASEQKPLDIWIIEVGLGGRLDATNLIDATVSIITSIDLDHQAFLGNTREAIAIEKLGIARPQRLLCVGEASPPENLLQQAEERGIFLKYLGQDFGYCVDTPQQWQYWLRTTDSKEPLKRRFGLPWPALRGEHQLSNAALVLTALDALESCPVSMQAVREGLLNVEWTARFQVLAGQPTIVWDVAHNPHAMRALAKNLDRMAFFPVTWCVWGMLSDKDARSCAKELIPHVQHWALCSLEGERSRTAQELCDLLQELGVKRTDMSCFTSPEEAYTWAKSQAQPADRIVVTGSFSTLAAINKRN